MKLFLTAIALILTLQAQAQISGSWNLYGFISDQNKNELSGSQVITGTLIITESGELHFDTNLGQFTDEVIINGSGENYEGFLSSMERSKRVRIKKVDDNTLLWSSGDAHYEMGALVEYNSAGLILTSEPIESSGTPSTAWLGTFTAEGIETCEKYPHTGVTSQIISEEVQILQNTGGVFSILGGNKRFTGFTSAGGKQLEATLIDRTLRQTSDSGEFSSYSTKEQESLNLLQLDDGRIFGVSNFGQLSEVRENEEGTVINNSLGEGFAVSFILQTTKVGEVSNVIIAGDENPYILRKGHKITASIGATLQEGDVVVAPARGLVQVTMIDETTHSIGDTVTIANSQFKIEKFVPTPEKAKKIYQLIKGRVRSFFKSDPTKRHEIRTRATVLGVRGTEFDTTYSEIDGISLAEVNLFTGSIEHTNLINGANRTLAPGEDEVIETASTPAKITFYSHGPVGEIYINDVQVGSFPHTVTTAVGEEVQVRAEATENSQFWGWTGDSIVRSDEWTLIAEGDQFIQANFTPLHQDAEMSYTNAITASGLPSELQDKEIRPFGGSSNFAKWAFNMDFSKFDGHELDLSFGSSGLPSFEKISTSEGSFMRLTYVQRANGAAIYLPEYSDDLASWIPFSGIREVVATSEQGWERVTIMKKVSFDDESQQFVRFNFSGPEQISTD